MKQYNETARIYTKLQLGFLIYRALVSRFFIHPSPRFRDSQSSVIATPRQRCIDQNRARYTDFSRVLSITQYREERGRENAYTINREPTQRFVPKKKHFRCWQSDIRPWMIHNERSQAVSRSTRCIIVRLHKRA